MPRITSTSVRVVKTISWHWPSTLSHYNVNGFDSPLTSMGTLPTPTTIVLDCLKDPRWYFHFWYHPHLQQDVVAPVSTRAATSTPAMVTLTTISWDALSDTGATNVPIWPLWHPLATLWRPLAPSGTLLHRLAPSGTVHRHLVFRLLRSSSLILSCSVPLYSRTLHQHVAFFATTLTHKLASNGIPRSLVFAS